MAPTPLTSKELSDLTYHSSRDHFDQSWQDPLSTLLGLGRAAGADFVEFFLERVNYISCLAEQDTVTSLSPRLSTGAGIRMFRGKEDCYVSTNDISFTGLKAALEKALSILELTFPSPNAYIPEINLEMMRDYAKIKDKEFWLDNCSSMAEMGDLLLSANAKLGQKANHVQSRRVMYFRDWQEILVAASDGVFARDIRLTQSVGNSLLCSDGEHRASMGKRFGNTSDPNFLREWDYETAAEEVAESAGKMLYADYVESGNYPIIMANQFGGVIFHEACGHLLETTQIEHKTTPFMEKKGEKIAHESLTAWDEGLSDQEFGTLDIDDEGMPTQRTLLIENGILKNFIADRTGSVRTGHPRTGSGRRQSYAYAAASRMRNTYIAPGDYSIDNLFASVDKGIYCKQMGGGSVGPTSEFNFSVSEAYLIEKGKVTKPLKGATLIGTAKDIMTEISMCSQDLGLAPGFCGSVSGSIYVTVGQPHLKVDKITVGGR
ncbi:putative modulator of DNA gyrase [cyanobacterium endosymbiont of Rhopalodia gibberula]|uniref:TldD/PmbA family protein n=1 Tax=cyanobacterium endosymbiont of Rhopalodia gibberula TaxID=1763363 RepID=UPI000DC6FD7C|nr:TldD/PmbA family protein [cyanobacterium endosymbiont of Rhopalodia gibberula]BBA79702.1 putative modulator of DNA gyrase [cyanobacterium endosymbiont of Rhopalodia gibberula]